MFIVFVQDLDEYYRIGTAESLEEAREIIASYYAKACKRWEGCAYGYHNDGFFIEDVFGNVLEVDARAVEG